MTETATATGSRRKEIEDEMEKVSAELRELAETNKILIEKLQILSSEKPIENGLHICSVCHCERKSDTRCQALKCRIHVLKENEKGREQEIELLNRTFIDLVSKFDNLIANAKTHAQGSNELMDTKTGIFLSNAAADGDSNGLGDRDNAASSPSKGQTIVDTSSVKVKTDSRNSAVKNSLNSDIGPNIMCYGDGSDSVDEDEEGYEYQMPKILPKAIENKTTGLTLGNPNFGPRKLQGKPIQERNNKETHQADTAKDQYPLMDILATGP